MPIEIRPAAANDANPISSIILAALRATNAKDYSPAVIEQVAKSFSPPAISAFIANRTVFVALLNGEAVGTASLDGHVVRAVFVLPQHHGEGIGRQLMLSVEQQARSVGVTTLLVPSSVTAQGFYRKLGYTVVRETFHGEERTLVMERSL